jgi:Kelch motif
LRRSAAWVLLVGLAATGCGGSIQAQAPGSGTSAQRTAAGSSSVRASTTVTLRYRPLFTLPAPLQDPAYAGFADGRFALLGGLDAADSSSSGVIVADTSRVTASASLPGAQHDAQATAFGRAVYVFGGGDFTQYDHILRVDPATGRVTTAGSLPQAQSDVAVTQVGGVAYVVGGFNGTSALDTIVAWHPGGTARVVAHLPVSIRYAAVAAVRGTVLVIGGSTPSGASDVIYRFDPATGGVARIGRLPHPTTHAGAATLGSTVYVVGGRGDLLDSQTDAIWSIDPNTGRVARAGRLPGARSDAAVLTLGGSIVVAGGRSNAGTLATVGELTPAGSPASG